jgi:hypothetical protein
MKVLEEKSLDLIAEMEYADVRNFGGPGGHFRVNYRKVTGVRDDGGELLLKFADGPAHQEMSYAIASYINEIVRQEGITCQAARINEDVEDHETSLDRVC